MVKIGVTDTGIGMTSNKQKELFTMFQTLFKYKGKEARSMMYKDIAEMEKKGSKQMSMDLDSTSGIGLGLFYCKTMI